MNIFKTPIKWLIEQLKPKDHIADVGKMVESEELGIWAISEHNLVIKELVKNKTDSILNPPFNLMNK